MLRNLERRVVALGGNREPQAVIDALDVIFETGKAPPGRAGGRALEIWRCAGDRDITDDLGRWLFCHIRAMGTSVADLVAVAPDTDV